MAICIQNVKTILNACKQIKQKQSLLILGDANVFFTPADLQKIAAQQNYPLSPLKPEPFDCYSFGQMLGFQKVETLDINGKTTIHFNLHDELPPELQSKFDCVLDAGVLYWCFDVAAAFKNIYKMVKTEGAIIHSTALTGYFGRGYYNIHPKAFEDFYQSKNCSLIEMSTYTKEPSLLNNLVKKIKGMGRVQRILGVENSPVWTASSTNNNFIEAASSDQLSFGGILQSPEPPMIPNNVIGTFAFRKNPCPAS